MIEGLPLYLTVVFILTTASTVGLFFYGICRAGFDSAPAKFLFGFVCVWVVATAILAYTGFFQNFDVVPPRTFAVGVWPFIGLTLVYLAFFRRFLGRMPLTLLTIIHVIRIPVEFCLLWLYQSGQVPIEMTFEGRNLDILSGFTAPLVYFAAFRHGRVNRWLLFIWNLGALLLLTNIITIAVLAFPSPFQMVGLEQPNIGVTFFPFIWLPAIIVPIVFFSHVSSMWKIVSGEIE